MKHRPNGVAVPGDPAAFSNGDGILLYPGHMGPLSSLRLENYRDGLEDLQLLRNTNVSAANVLIQGFKPSGLPYSGLNASKNFSLLESVRRHLLSQS